MSDGETAAGYDDPYQRVDGWEDDAVHRVGVSERMLEELLTFGVTTTTGSGLVGPELLVLDYVGGEPVSPLEMLGDGERPEHVTTGRDPTVGVGNFVCACGAVIADADSDDDDAIELTAVPDGRLLPDDDLVECPDCDRTWRLVDDGEHWEVLGDE